MARGVVIPTKEGSEREETPETYKKSFSGFAAKIQTKKF